MGNVSVKPLHDIASRKENGKAATQLREGQVDEALGEYRIDNAEEKSLAHVATGAINKEKKLKDTLSASAYL